jgi:hypothetical protein
MYGFALVLALCAGIVAGALVLSYAHFTTMPQATEAPPAFGHYGDLPPLW